MLMLTLADIAAIINFALFSFFIVNFFFALNTETVCQACKLLLKQANIPLSKQYI